MQLRACLSGAASVLGKERCCLRVKRRVVRARIRVSMLESELSRARRTSTGEKRLNTSSVDSGSSQNCQGSVGWDKSVNGNALLSNMDPQVVLHRVVKA